MKALFELAEKPQYVYVTEDQAQQEYADWRKWLGMVFQYGGVYPAYMTNLTFEQWLVHMEYIVY